MADEGAVTVCVRVRPLIGREKASDKVSLHWRSENNTVSDVSGTKTFSYDRVFHSSDNTQQLYDGVAVPIIQSAVRGYNGTIFAYGQTASGKTYTMMGNEDSVGIIPKAIQHVFKIICEIPDREFLLRVSYMEIYNETITDLLCDNRKKKPLGIREDVNRNTYVEDLIEEVVVSPEQVMECIRKGEKNRHYGETKMNEHSSRSHTIFRMIIESRERSDPANANCDGAVMVSHLNLVDLAGSERASQTGSEGVRLKEGCNINRSLFILGQVIKKLCDDPSGFINYRDSKLTRILQNSLGGNAKTVIICTITPVSFDETLSTLQFANTAKGMKNTPKVNEVLDDDALLKRYRKEILDLKKQLEEVSSKTQIHAMEKDQLAQLLEEKNSLQKVQEDRIRNLTEMLVTSASFASKENVKAKRIKRRLTWAAGKINQENVSFFEDFENPMLTETKKMKLSLPAVPDVEDSTLENSGYDSHCPMVPDQTSEEEWIAGPNMNWKDFKESVQLCEALELEKNIAVNEVNVLQTNFDNLVLENEQLKSEINELKERLKEKMEIDEFEALEKQTQKDHEIQLMHEITNLKNLVSNAEVYNEELEAEINSKLEQLKEKENKIKILQNRVEELQKAEVEKRETSFALGDCDKLTEEIHQLNKSLLDSEAIALDAKKESAFLRSENLELKEKMKELLNNHNQMQKDVQLYQSQIEAGKASYRKMQADLQRELQSLFQENTRLTSLMEGKVPKDLLSHVELEKKAADLKGELEKALKDNALLQKQVNELSEFQLLPNTVEMQKKEILEKCEELHLLKLENEKLLSEVADNERRLKHMSEEIEKSKDNLTDVQLKFTKSDEEYVALKQLHEETEQKYIAASETNEQMKLQIECLSREAQESKTILDEVKLELSSKMKELEEKEAEQKQLLELRENLVQTQQKLNELEQLKEEERISEVRLETKDLEIQAALQQLTECQEEIKTLTQERDNLKQKEEFLQAETEQLREDIKDTVSMNILAHEDLRNTQNALKESQKTVKKLEKSISEKEIQIMSVEEALGKTIKELQIQLSEMTEEMKIITSERDQLAEEKSERNSCRESDQLQVQMEQIIFLTQENRSLQEKLDSLLLRKEEFGEGTLIPQIQGQSMEQELFLLREELSQAQQKLHEMEEAKASEYQGESEKMERTDVIPKPHDSQEVSIQTEGDGDDFKMQLEDLQKERDQLREMLQETISKNSEMQEELRCTRESLGQHQEKIVELEGSVSEKENELSKAQEALKEKADELQQKLSEVTENLTRVLAEYGDLLAEKQQAERAMSEQLERITSLTKEKDELQHMVETCKEREEHLLKVQRQSEILEDSLTSKLSEVTENLTRVSAEYGDLLAEKQQAERAMSEQLERITSLTKEKDELQHMVETCKEREEHLLKVQRQSEILEDSLTSKLSEVTENLTRVSAEYGDLLAEKQQAERAMSEQLERITSLTKEKDELQHMVETCKEREEHLLKVQRQSEILEDSLTSKIQQLTETLNSVSCEKDQLLAERTSYSLQVKEQISSLNHEKDELQKLLQDVRSERDQLKTELQRTSEVCVETKAKLEDALERLKQRNLHNMSIQVNPMDIAEQVANGSLTEKTLKIKELLEKFPSMGKRYECLSTASLKLKSELNSQKALIAEILPQLTLGQSKQIKMLQTKNEEMNTRLQKLLTKLKLLFSSVCTKRGEYHATVHRYEMELLEEKRKQDHLQSQIQCIRKINLKQNEVSSQELNSCEGLQSFYLDAESILKDVSEMENELVCIEADLKQEESARKETIQFWEACSGTHWDAEELKEELNKDNERLLQVFKFWTPKVKILLELCSELDARTADYSKNADAELKQRKEKNEELLQDLNTLKEKLAPGGSASLALEEENYRLHNKLKAAEQDKKAMEVKIQKLENVINEVGEGVKERDDRISKLQAQIKIRTETSELTQLQAKLKEMENCLKTALTEKQSLQAKLDKGAELYKEEIDHLKTQLVKSDLERMKQSNSFEVKLTNYKALAEHREQQLTKLKEELRRAHQEQDVTVLKEADPQQSQTPLTCGGGSGIVQSTQILVLKSEQAKLQKENLQLKKQNDLLLSDELELKEELRKWKERALKWRERSSRETTRETTPKSPKKAVSYFFKEQMPSPCKETVSQEKVTQDLPKPLPLTCPTNFFDNSNLGVLTDTGPECKESTEEHLRHLFGTSDRDKAPDCSTQ
ncbi:centromere-associated protein E isoform X13 [Serinus canaria]|uniref:centromere-associated protein E isoform X11 n=1 Tax=Serinus canaria TaxID=9135 RepID=UPI0021CCD411|nr:centromere-associated protein E isoform X11 [Serinus canaria]XP_050829632.1 centromere-associated protein E isoform X12 [Serinus canaria]XP_050829633.1 centromere-associated protein E isoform X13 [Serinus canaria]